jgi:hypothetical protein
VNRPRAGQAGEVLWGTFLRRRRAVGGRWFLRRLAYRRLRVIGVVGARTLGGLGPALGRLSLYLL